MCQCLPSPVLTESENRNIMVNPSSLLRNQWVCITASQMFVRITVALALTSMFLCSDSFTHVLRNVECHYLISHMEPQIGREL